VTELQSALRLATSRHSIDLGGPHSRVFHVKQEDRSSRALWSPWVNILLLDETANHVDSDDAGRAVDGPRA
jgi:hypothetical protein